jgi:glycosyltransferase involved in cell wall biosynthesis
MRILMIAPEPFFEPRGTPFSVFHRARALGRLGHEIDLVTYPIGNAVDLPHVTVHRTWRPPFVRQIKIGPSLIKFPLDALLFVQALGMLLRHRYDCIHTHEEAGLFGAIFSRLFRVPHIYDMHSDLAQQLTNFHFTRSKFLIGAMRRLEQVIIDSASAVIVICPELLASVEAVAPDKPVVLIENTAVAADEVDQMGKRTKMSRAVGKLRRELDIPKDAGPVLLYTGTFESYQGLDLLVESMPAVLAKFPDAVYVVAGGQPDQVAAIAAHAQRLGVASSLRLPGQRPPEDMPIFTQLADVLLSPRCQGTNTPLKIYSYLHSGKPILATGIRSHTQVLNDEVAMLVAPTSEGLADGAIALLEDERLRGELARNARALAQQKYSYQSYLERTSEVYRGLVPVPEPVTA